MFDQSLIDAAWGSVTPMQPQKKKKPTGRGGSATSFISEGGALGGAAAGAAVGSVVPIVGTAIGGLVGAGLGAFGGRLIENKARDDEFRVGSAATEGALTTVLGGPGKLIKGGLAARSAVRQGDGLVDALTAAATASSAKKGGVKAAAGNKLSGASDNLATRALKLNGSQFNTDFANKTGEEVGQFATRFGLINKDAKTIKSTIYDPAQKVYSAAVTQIGDVPKADVLKTIQKELAPKLNSAFPEEKKFAQSVLDQANTILIKYGRTIPATELNKLKSEAYSKVNKKFVDKSGVDSNNLYDTLSNSFRKSIGEAADKRGIEVDPNVLREAGLNFKSTRLSDFGNELNALNEITRKIDVASRVGKGSSIFGLNRSTGAVGGGVLGGPVGAAAGFAGSALAGSPRVMGAAAKGLNVAGDALQGGVRPQGSGAIRAGAQGIVGANLVDSLMGAGQSDMAPDMSTMDPNSMNMSNADNMGTLSPDQAGTASANPYSREALLSDIQRDPANQAKYIEYYQMMQELYPESTTPELTSGQATRAASAQNALRDIPLLMEAIESGKLGGAKALPGSGTAIGRRVLGTEDLDAAMFNIADNILRARSGAAAPEAEVRRFVNTFLPAPTDSAEAKRLKLDRTMRELQSMLNPAAAAGGTLSSSPADLTEALMSSGQY